VRLHDIPQRTPEWHALRAGKLTGSVAKDMLAKGRGSEPSTKRRDLKFRLLAERLTGRPQEDGYVNDAMKWGIEHEQEAIGMYEAARNCLVEPIGFVEHDDLPVGTSPDGFVGEAGIVSIKCPKTATHIAALRAKAEPAEHWAQNTHELWLTGRAWLDFVSYDPRLPDQWQLFVVRVMRIPAELAAYEREVLTFLAEVDREIEALKTMTNLVGVLQEIVA
jgi:hypothetical protein